MSIFSLHSFILFIGSLLSIELGTGEAAYGLPLLKSLVLWNIMEIVSSNNYRVFHLSRDAYALKYSASDTNVASERTLLVNISS